jgi:AP2-associated kinase
MFCRRFFVSLLQGELSNAGTAYGRSLSADIADWNPFEDPTPFSQMTEDHIFGAFLFDR